MFGVLCIDRPVLVAVPALPRTFQVYTGIISQLGRAEPYLIPAGLLFLFFRFVRRNQRYANRALFFIAAVTVAVAVDRVLCQAHYPTDVVAGAYLGIVSAMFVYAGFRRRCQL